MHSRSLLTCAISAVALSLAGCVSGPVDPRSEVVASEAVALPAGEAIVFRAEADPLDDPSAAKTSLGLADVVRFSVQRSPTVQAAIARVRIAQAEAQQSRLLPNPIVSLALRFPEGGGKPVIDAGLTADLLTVLRRPGSIDVADARLRTASAEVVEAVLDVAASAQESYYTIQAGEASLAVLREREGLIQRLLDLAESRLRIGEGTRLDVITLQTQRVELDTEIADAELELRDARLTLARLIGVPSAEPTWTLPEWTPAERQTLDETACVRAALKARPDVQQREWDLIALGAERRLAAWEVLGGSDVGAAAERDGDWSFGPSGSVPLPIFDTGAAGKAKATAALIEGRHQLTAVRRQVVEDVRRAYSTVKLTQSNLVRVRDELLPLQERRLQQAEAQFRAGQTDITALLLAEQDLRSTRAKLIELQRRSALARVRLERSVGGAAVIATTQPSTKPVNATTQPAR